MQDSIILVFIHIDYMLQSDISRMCVYATIRYYLQVFNHAGVLEGGP